MLHLIYNIGRDVVIRFPLKVGYKLAEAVADLYYLCARDDRRNLTHNLKIVLGTDDEELIKKHIRRIFRNFAKYLVDFCRFPILDSKYFTKNITITGRENLDKALAKKKGVILLSAHIGNWELGAVVVSRLGPPFHAIILDHADKRVNDFFEKQRSSHSINPISLGGQLKNCFRVLRKNELLAIVSDRDFTNTGIKADFFGRPAILPKGAAALSLKTGAPIIPTFLIRTEDDKFRLSLERPLESRVTGDKEADVKNAMRGYLSVIEKYVKEFPDQWYAFKKIWE